jgi:hypothetical protein
MRRPSARGAGDTSIIGKRALGLKKKGVHLGGTQDRIARRMLSQSSHSSARNELGNRLVMTKQKSSRKYAVGKSPTAMQPRATESIKEPPSGADEQTD